MLVYVVASERMLYGVYRREYAAKQLAREVNKTLHDWSVHTRVCNWHGDDCKLVCFSDLQDSLRDRAAARIEAGYWGNCE